MKNGTLLIGIAVAAIGLAVAGGLLLSRGNGTPALSRAPSPGERSASAGSEPVVASTPPVAETPPPAESAPVSGSATGATTIVTTAAAAPVEAAIIDLIQKQAEFDGRVVTIKGQVLAQCMAGCEFSVDDGTGTLNVKLEGDALDELIAKGSVGKKVVVTGTFVRNPRPQIVLEKTGGWHFQ